MNKNKFFNNTKKIVKANLKNNKWIIVPVLVVAVAVLAILFNINAGGKAVATVNGNKISMNELDNQYDFLFFIMAYPEETKETLTKEVFLNQMINEELLLGQAAVKGVVITDEDVDTAIQAIITQGGLTLEGVEKTITDNGFTMKEFRDYYQKQLVMSKLLEADVYPLIEVTQKEVLEAYNQNSAQFNAQEGQIRARHILVETEGEADDIIKELLNGASFVDMAAQYSIGPSGPNGGELGFFGKGQMVKEFEDAAFALQINGLSKPVQTQFGWHIIQREPNTVTLSEAYNSIAASLSTEKQRSAIESYLTELTEEADIVVYMETDEEVGIISDASTVSGTECYSGAGLTENTMIFYHADWCPHCKNMEPIVKELEAEGYDFHWAETSSGEGVDVVKSCFSDVLQGGVPEFICAGNSAYKMGEMSKSQLKNFANSCKA